MALIGEIRERSWLLIVLIGLAMAGFIFMDMFSGKQSILSGRQLTIGEVAGRDITQPQFERAYSAVYSNSQGDANQQRAQMWNFLVEDELVRKEAGEIGLTVPTEELEDLQYGSKLSPVIESRFRDPQTRQVNRETLNSYRDAERDGSLNDRNVVDPSRRAFWLFQKREVNKQRLQDKLSSLVSKSMYTPDWMAEELAKGQNTRVDLAYVKVPYEAIDDASVQLTDADYTDFIAREGYRFKRADEGRSLGYVAFAVAPTAADSATYRSNLQETARLWNAAPDDSVFVAQQRGAYPTAYVADDQLPEQVRGREVGALVGPYLDGNRYTIAKVVDRKVLPDSVRSRHILLPGKTQAELSSSIALADSLENLIETGQATFDELARQFSTGPTSTKGGDLGYVAPGAMVPAFNDLIFYTAEEGELNRTLTQFGLHIVEVTGKKFIDNEEGTRVATISVPIEPSTTTQKARYEEASRFAQTNRTVDALRAAAEADPELEFVGGNVAGANDFVVGTLGSSSASRDMIKYAFGAEVGEVSPSVYAFKAPGAFYDGNYVVAANTGEVAAGVPTLATAKATLRDEVLRAKKAAAVAAAGSDIAAVARRYDVEPDTARAVNFGSAFVPGIGSEPKVLAQAFSLDQQATSAPIAGNGGIFVVKPLVRTEAGDVTASVDNVRRTQDAQVGNAVRNSFGISLREGAEVTDERSRFY